MDPQHPPSPADEQSSFAEWLSRLHAELKRRLIEPASVPQQRRAVSQRQVLLRLEQMWKIETQLILPALADEAALQPALQQGLQEVELLRDAALLVERSEPDLRDIAWTIVLGLTELHFARIGGLLKRAAASRADWRGLRDEARAWLATWDAETLAHGDIEDEDQDPVGLPPR